MATLYCTRHPSVLSRVLFAVDLHRAAVGLRPLRLGCVLSLGGASFVSVSCLSPLLHSLVLLFTSLHSYPAFHTNLLSLLLFLASPASSSAVLVPLCDTRRCSRDRKPIPNPDIAITIRLFCGSLHCLLPVLPHSPSTPHLFSPFPHLARVFSAKLRACRTCRVHPLVLLDTVSQDRQVTEGDMGRGALWQVWFTLPQA